MSDAATTTEQDAATTPIAGRSNPFVGLRPFDTTESLLFFGRRQQTIELLERLHNDHFIVVIGSSGCGKSSLIRAGMIPKLLAGFLVEDRDQWLIAQLKPGDAPLEHLLTGLAEALTHAGVFNSSIDSNEPDPDDRDMSLFGFDPEKLSLDEAVYTGDMAALLDCLSPTLDKANANLLLLVDQFEELFRFGIETDSQGQRNEATTFVELLLRLSRQRQLPIYVVLTMRADFLGDCDNFHGLPEALNRSQYLVPRLTREQRRQAIEGPVRLFGAEIAPRLLDRLLNDVGDQTDQLPVLQHALMRTWEHWRACDTGQLDLTNYEAVGTINDALARDAEAALSGLSEDELKLAERMFRALTATDANNRKIRRPAHLKELCEITSASKEQLRKIIERFRGDNRSFLILSNAADPLVDISHESLIRQWEKLGQWMDAEDQSREIYLRLVTAARRHQRLATPFYNGIDLDEALKWRDESQPNAAWGRRYSEDFALAMEFLAESQKSWEEFEKSIQELEREEEAKRKRELLRTRLFATVVTVLLIAASGLAWYAYRQQQTAKEQERRAGRLYYAASMNAAQEAYERGDGAQVYQILSAFLPQPANLALSQNREFSWYRLWRASKERQTLSGHGESVRSVAFAPDGRTLASASDDYTVKLWDVASGQVKQMLSGHASSVWSVAFTPDGRTLASASWDKTVKLWDVVNGQILVTFKEHTDIVSKVAFARQGNVLASAGGGGPTDGKTKPDFSIWLWFAATEADVARQRNR